MSTQINPSQHRDGQPRKQMPRAWPQTPDHNNHHEQITTAPRQDPVAEPALDQPIPEFLQVARRHAADPSAPRPPAETVVPVLDDQPPLTQEAPGLSPYELDELEREIMRAQQARPRRAALAPEYMPPPPPPRPQARLVSGDSMSALVMRLGGVGAIVLLCVLLFLGKIAMPESWKTAATEPLRHLVNLIRPAPSAPLKPQIAATASLPIMPKLVIEGADAGNGDDIGIGVKVTGPIEGVTAIISGIAAGTTLSKGQPWGETGWYVPAAQLAETKLRPPAGFSGTMQYTVALKMPDAKIADQQTLRLQWTDTSNAESRDRGSASLRKLDPDEITVLLKRGQTMFENGDLSGARLLLQRAAEAGDPVAAMAMAATYDPSVLKDLGVRGLTADVGKARFWYEKAREYGSKEAPRRLESLASQGR